MSRQGGSWLFLHFDWKKYSTDYSTVLKLEAILIMWVSLGINMLIRWVFNSCLFSIFVLMVLTCEMSDPGGGVKYSIVLHIA